MYRIRAVDYDDEVDLLDQLHSLCFGTSAPAITEGHNSFWWLVHADDHSPVAFAGLAPSHQAPCAGYLYRVGVLPSHQGHGLQKRLIRVRERTARRLGWQYLQTDTYDSPASANSLIACGYKVFTPENPWAFALSTYWRKYL